MERKELKMEGYTFINDIELMTDLLTLMVENPDNWFEKFAKSHQRYTQNEIEDTVKEISGQSLADLYRIAENMHIEEMNGRDTGLVIDSQTAKDAIVLALSLLPDVESRAFEDACESMGC